MRRESLTREEFNTLFYKIKKSYAEEPVPDVVQSPEELWWVYAKVYSIRPKVILEIGTANGGTAKFWEKTLDSDGLLVTADIRVHLRDEYNFCDFSDAVSELHILENFDSQNPNSVEIIRRILGTGAVDFLYIDAAHSYEGLKIDYEFWTPLVRSGGLVGFHDTNHPPIKQLLLEKGHPNLKFIDHGFGTGLIEGW